MSRSPPRTSRAGWRLDPWYASAILLAGVILVPLISVLLGLGDGGPMWGHVASTVLAGYVANTALLVLIVSGLVLLMALPPAWLVSAFHFPGRGWLEWTMVLPLAIPTYVAAFVYFQAPEACIPILIGIRDRFGPDAFRWAEAGLRYGVLSMVLASVLYPYVYLTARASFARQHRAIIEAAQTLGRSPRLVFFSVALPLARPAIVAGLSLVVMEVVNDYGAVHFFGVPTLTEGVFRTWFGLGDSASGVRLAGMMTAAVLLLLLLERIQRGRAQFAVRSGEGGALARRPLRGWRGVLACLTCLVPLALGLVFPVAQLGIWAAETAQGASAWPIGMDGVRSMMLSLAAAGGLCVAALILCYASRLHAGGWIPGLTRVASLGYATPGAAVAVGVMMVLGNVDQAWAAAWSETPVPVWFLSGTVFAIGFAYLVRFIAVPYHAVQAGMTRVCGALDEASRTLGYGPTATLWHINLPLLRGTLIASGMLVFVDILKELPLTMLLRPAGFETLAVTAFGLAKEGRIQECAVPSLAIVVVGAAGLAVLNRWMTCQPTQTNS